MVDEKPVGSPSNDLSADRGSESEILVPTSQGLDHAIAAFARNSARLYGRSGHCASEWARPRPGADLRPDKVRSLRQWLWRLLHKVRAVLQRPGVVTQAGSASATVGARVADGGGHEEEAACGPANYATREAGSPLWHRCC